MLDKKAGKEPVACVGSQLVVKSIGPENSLILKLESVKTSTVIASVVFLNSWILWNSVVDCSLTDIRAVILGPPDLSFVQLAHDWLGRIAHAQRERAHC